MSQEGMQRGATSAQLKDAIDRGATGSKVPNPDPAASPLGTDDEAAGMPPSPQLLKEELDRETRPAPHKQQGRDHSWAREQDEHASPTRTSSSGLAIGAVAAVIAAFVALLVIFGG